MNELELRQLFKNLSDCYADTGRFENDGSYTEGEVIQAMTEDRFIEALKEAKILPIPVVSNLLCGYFELDNKTSSATKCKCGREKWEHPKAT
jgi:hypothetical protein